MGEALLAIWTVWFFGGLATAAHIVTSDLTAPEPMPAAQQLRLLPTMVVLWASWPLALIQRERILRWLDERSLLGRASRPDSFFQPLSSTRRAIYLVLLVVGGVLSLAATPVVGDVSSIVVFVLVAGFCLEFMGPSHRASLLQRGSLAERTNSP